MCHGVMQGDANGRTAGEDIPGHFRSVRITFRIRRPISKACFYCLNRVAATSPGLSRGYWPKMVYTQM